MEHVLYMYDGGAMRFPRGYLPVVPVECAKPVLKGMDLLMY
jgi:hypothetical protein